MTTGMIDFMINSGLITDMAAIPTPDFAVPYAAPKATQLEKKTKKHFRNRHIVLQIKE
jgi:hypothetical protein